jgi:hypothetical protein
VIRQMSHRDVPNPWIERPEVYRDRSAVRLQNSGKF